MLAICSLMLLFVAGCTDADDLIQITGAEPSFSGSSVSPESGYVAVGESIQLAALNYGDNEAKASWSSSDPEIVSVSPDGLVTGVAEGTATITAAWQWRSSTAVITVTEAEAGEEDAMPVPSDPPGGGADDIVVQGFTTKAVRDGLAKVGAMGGGVLHFPAGTYDLRDWPSGGVQVNVPVTLIGEPGSALQGDGRAVLWDFGASARVEGLELRGWLRALRWQRLDSGATLQVERSRFLDIATALEGRGGAGRVGLVRVAESEFQRVRRVVDFRFTRIDRFEFTHNTVREVVRRSSEPDLPGDIASVLYMGADSESGAQRATEVIIRYNDIRQVRNEDQAAGRVYALLAYRGPTIVEHNHIEDLAGQPGFGVAAIYQRSYTYARFAHNTVVDASNTTNVAALMAKQSGSPWEVLSNEIVFTDAYKDRHGAAEYDAFESALADLRFEGNTVRGATRVFVTRMESSNFGKAKTTRLLVRDNLFQDCVSRQGSTTNRSFTIGYRRLLVDVSENRFVDCGRTGTTALIFVNGGDNFHETDELRIADNEWTYTRAQPVPERLIYFHGMARRTTITHNRYSYPTGASSAPPIFATLAPIEGAASAQAAIADNDLSGFRGAVIDNRAGLAELRIERNRAHSGGNFTELRVTAPALAVVRDNNAAGITGVVVHKAVEGGELIVSGNSP